MTLTTTAVRDIPPIRHDEAMDLAATDWAWTISGRARGSGLLANSLPL